MNEYRTHNCGELRISDVGKEVKVAKKYKDSIEEFMGA